MKKITVIVPIYNVENYLDACIQSLIKQTYLNLQIILVNDGSTDSSGEICNKYAERDSRIEVIHQANEGLVSARKSGLERAIGDYIGFVDGDDYIEKEMYGELLDFISRNQVEFVHSGYIRENVVNIDFSESIQEFSGNNIDFLEKYLTIDVNKAILHNICFNLFRADLIKKCYQKVPNTQQWGEDLICFCACILESQKVGFKSAAYYHYVVREESLTQQNPELNLLREYGLCNSLIELFEEYGCRTELFTAINTFFRRQILPALKQTSEYDFQIMQYYYDGINMLRGKRVALYGAGNVGKDYYAQISRYSDIRIVFWIDLNYENYSYDFFEITGTESLDKYKFDFIIIAIEDRDVAESIKAELLEKNIPIEKIICEAPCLMM